MQSRFRVYLFDLNKPKGEREMTDHPAHGSEWSGSGPHVNGNRKTMKDVVVISPDCKKFGIGSGPGYGKNHVRLIADDFPGQRVLVKVWHPDGVTDLRVLR